MKGCIKCGQGNVNYPIWVHQEGIEPPDCYCDRFIGEIEKCENPCKKYKWGDGGLICMPDWTKYMCENCRKDKPKRMLRPVGMKENKIREEQYDEELPDFSMKCQTY